MPLVDRHKKTPSRAVRVPEVLFCAVLGKVDRLRFALAAGGDANARDPDGFSALHAAAENGQLVAVQVLLTSGADPTRKTRDGLLALDLAEMNGHDGVARLLRQYSS